MCYHDESIRGHCSYCKEKILENESYVVSGDDLLHVECNNQMNSFMDSFGDVIPYSENLDEN